MTIYREHFAGKLVPALMIFSLTVAYPYQQALAAKDVTKIGVTTIVKNKVLGEPPKMVQRRLKTGLEVYFNEKVETGPVGRTQLLFKDGTAITIGPNANMTIDKYVFDPNAGTGDMALSVTKGVFRIVGGRISKRKPIKLKTPVATLGVMGGIVVVDQAANGKLNADFLFGNKMTVTANNVTVTTRIPGRFISVTGSGQPPGPSQKRDRAEMKKNLEKLEGGGAEEKTAAAEETTAPKKTGTQKSEESQPTPSDDKKSSTTTTSSAPAEEKDEGQAPTNEQSSNTASSENSASTEKEDTPPLGNKGGTEPSKTANQNNETGKTETAAAPIPGGEGGPMPMPGGEGGPMPMPGGDSGPMPMPGSDGGQMPMMPMPGSDGEQMPMMPMASGEGGPMPMMPMPGSDGGQMPMMPMPGSDGGQMPMMPMPGSDGGQIPMMPMAQAAPMPMPMNINAMMDTGMGKVEMAPPINIQMIMPPIPSGVDGMSMMPMPQPGPAGPNSGGPVGEAPAGISTDIGNERNESFVREPEVLAGVPASALANLSPEEVAGVNAIFQDNNAGIALAPPIQNPDGTFNPDQAPGGFVVLDPGRAGPIQGGPAFLIPDGRGGFLPAPDGPIGFAPLPGGEGRFPPPPGGEGQFPPPPGGEGQFPPPPSGEGQFPPPPGTEDRFGNPIGFVPPPGAEDRFGNPIGFVPPSGAEDRFGAPSSGENTDTENGSCEANLETPCEIANNPTSPGDQIAAVPPSDNQAGEVPSPGSSPDPVAGTDPSAGSGTDPSAGSGTDPSAGSGTDPSAGSGADPNAGSGAGPLALTQNLVVLTTTPISSTNLISVSSSTGLSYLIRNPDVMIHAKNIVDARGIPPGRAYQQAMEQVALEHYNTFGRAEGRHIDGIERSQQLSLQKATPQPLIQISESPSLQYLIDNPDVMLHARQAVKALGIAPGRDFQRAMEQQAINHFNNFGRAEGRIGPEQ